MSIRDDAVNATAITIAQKYDLDVKDVKMLVFMALDDYEITERKTEIILYKADEDERILQKFFATKIIKGCTKKTLKYYKMTIENVAKKIGKNLTEIDTDDLRRYLIIRQTVDQVTRATCLNEMRVMSSIFSWMTMEKIIAYNPTDYVERIKTSTQKKKAFTDDEVEKIRYEARTTREIALIEILLSTGCRISEVVNAKIVDIKNDEMLVHGKGEKDRIVYLNEKWKSEAQRDIMKDYMPCRLWIREDTCKGRIGKLRKRRRK